MCYFVNQAVISHKMINLNQLTTATRVGRITYLLKAAMLS